MFVRLCTYIHKIEDAFNRCLLECMFYVYVFEFFIFYFDCDEDFFLFFLFCLRKILSLRVFPFNISFSPFLLFSLVFFMYFFYLKENLTYIFNVVKICEENGTTMDHLS